VAGEKKAEFGYFTSEKRSKAVCKSATGEVVGSGED